MTALGDLKKADLASYVGQDIKEICNTGYEAANVNHCAHFVSHVLGIKLGLVCGSMKWETRGEGTSLRVNEIYNACSPRGDWDSRPAAIGRCLVFATTPGNMSGDDMGEHPRKHIGIFIEDTIWHYSNGGDKVVTDSPTSFLNKFKGVYGASTKLYYGVPGA